MDLDGSTGLSGGSEPSPAQGTTKSSVRGAESSPSARSTCSPAASGVLRFPSSPQGPSGCVWKAPPSPCAQPTHSSAAFYIAGAGKRRGCAAASSGSRHRGEAEARPEHRERLRVPAPGTFPSRKRNKLSSKASSFTGEPRLRTVRCKTAMRAARSDLPASGAGSTHILGMFAAFLAKLLANQPEASPSLPRRLQPPSSRGHRQPRCAQRVRGNPATTPTTLLFGDRPASPLAGEGISPRGAEAAAQTGAPEGRGASGAAGAGAGGSAEPPGEAAADSQRSRWHAQHSPLRFPAAITEPLLARAEAGGRRRGGFFPFPWEFGGFFPFKPGVSPWLRCSRHPGRSAPHGPWLPP